MEVKSEGELPDAVLCVLCPRHGGYDERMDFDNESGTQAEEGGGAVYEARRSSILVSRKARPGVGWDMADSLGITRHGWELKQSKARALRGRASTGAASFASLGAKRQ